MGMGSAALAAAVPYPGKATKFPASIAFAAAVPYPGKATKFPARDKEVRKTIIKKRQYEPTTCVSQEGSACIISE